MRVNPGSIQHQKQILTEYAEKNGFPNPRIWADDGFSGVTFDRSSCNEMMTQVESGNASTIIVKDHSRLGRNRLVKGCLIEEKFSDYGYGTLPSMTLWIPPRWWTKALQSVTCSMSGTQEIPAKKSESLRWQALSEGGRIGTL